MYPRWYGCMVNQRLQRKGLPQSIVQMQLQSHDKLRNLIGRYQRAAQPIRNEIVKYHHVHWMYNLIGQLGNYSLDVSLLQVNCNLNLKKNELFCGPYLTIFCDQYSKNPHIRTYSYWLSLIRFLLAIHNLAKCCLREVK